MPGFDDWALTLAVFIPLVGLAAVLFIPRAQEQAIKVTALITSVATLAVGIGILADFNFGNGGGLQIPRDKPPVPGIHAPAPMGGGRIPPPPPAPSLLMLCRRLNVP